MEGMIMLITDPHTVLSEDHKNLLIDVPIPVYSVCTTCQNPADEIVVKKSIYFNNAVVTLEFRCHHCREKIQ